MNYSDTVEPVLDVLDRVTGPGNMDKQEAVEVMRTLVSDIQMRIENLESEIEDDES